MSDEALKQKRELYQAWDSLANSDDDTPDPGREASIEAMRKAPQAKHKANTSTQGLARTTSDSTIGQQSRRQQVQREGSPPGRPPSSLQVPAKLISRHTFSGTPSRSTVVDVPRPAVISKAGTKRKRENDILRIPEDQQILKGLRFFFFLNNDKNPARKIRIAKSAEYGAVWIKDFDEEVTHIIVDKGMEYEFLLKFLKRQSIPSTTVVVSEDYPAECITYRMLLDPHQARFRIKGQMITSTTRPVLSRSDKSLELKAGKKSVTTREPQTPEGDEYTDEVPGPALAFNTTTTEETQTIQQVAAPSNIESTAEFDAAIAQARELEHVPLDEDEEAASRPTTSEGPDTDDEVAVVAQKAIKPKTKFRSMEDKFQCMQKHTGSKTEPPNAPTIAILQQMADYYGKIGDEWRIRAYRKAIGTLRNHKIKVCTREEALALPQIGERLATKIEEIAFTNRLRRLDNAKAEPSDQVFEAFMQIYGVGPAQANKWVDAGYKTVDEVLEKAQLTVNQRIGIEHYADFQTRIPRAEVEQHGRVVKDTLYQIDPAFEVIVGGSYRRGAETSGDIDCMITHPHTGSAFIRQTVLERLIPALFAKNFLVAALAASTPGAPPRPWRRIDFLLVPSGELGAALIYFTGDDIFNRSIRLLAGTKGMRLNQRGLYKDVIRGKNREKLSEGTLVEGKDEKKIFEILGVPWRPPEHRIC